MALFAIADLHLAFSSGQKKSMDIFLGWENYIEKLCKNWKSIVKEEDTVVIVGDVSWAMKLEETYKDFNFLQSLPGKKLIIKGNHDYWWSSRKKIDTYFENNKFDSLSVIYNTAETVGNIAVCGTRGWFCDCSKDEDIKILNREVGRLETSISIAKKTNLEPIAFLHYPPVYGDYECEKIMDVLIKNNIKRCYYGHIHGKLATKKAIEGIYKGINFKLVSCDYTNFTPILVSK